MSNTLYDHAPIKGRCLAAVSNGPRSFSWHQCTREAVKGGFCAQHTPEAIASRAQARKAAWEQKQKRSDIVYDDRDALLSALKKVVAAWESLPGGEYYSASDVEDWLGGAMKRAINAARKTIKSVES